VTLFREEVEADAFANSTSTASTLGRVGLGDERLDETTDLALLVKPAKERNNQRGRAS
jgi:hypothetical protein